MLVNIQNCGTSICTFTFDYAQRIESAAKDRGGHLVITQCTHAHTRICAQTHIYEQR